MDKDNAINLSKLNLMFQKKYRDYVTKAITDLVHDEILDKIYLSTSTVGLEEYHVRKVLYEPQL